MKCYCMYELLTTMVTCIRPEKSQASQNSNMDGGVCSQGPPTPSRETIGSLWLIREREQFFIRGLKSCVGCL